MGFGVSFGPWCVENLRFWGGLGVLGSYIPLQGCPTPTGIVTGLVQDVGVEVGLNVGTGAVIVIVRI